MLAVGVAPPSRGSGDQARRAALIATAVVASFLALGLAYVFAGPGVTLAYGAAVLYLGIGMWMWKTSQLHFLLLLPFYFEWLTAIVSNVYLEHGTLVTEQYRYSFPTGSTLRLTSYVSVFLGALFLTMRQLAPSATLRAAALREVESGRARVFCLLILAIIGVFETTARNDQKTS